MSHNHSFPIKRSLLGVTALFGLFLLLLVVDALNEASEEFAAEKKHVSATLKELSNTLRAVEYEMTSLSQFNLPQYPASLKSSIKDITCSLEGEPEAGIHSDFIIAGIVDMCDERTSLYQDAHFWLPSAHVMSYLVNTHGAISSFYFISKDQFIISSPSELARNITSNTFDEVLKYRPFWRNTMKYGLANNSRNIAFTGEYRDLFTGKSVVTLSAAVYKNGGLAGVLAMDVLADQLKRDLDREYEISPYAGENRSSLLSYKKSGSINDSSQNTRLHLNIDQTWQQHIYHLWRCKHYWLVTWFVSYLFVVTLLISKNWSLIQDYEDKLIHIDDDTGLLNIKGLEARLGELREQPYLIVAAYTVKDTQYLSEESVIQVKTHVQGIVSERLRSFDIMAASGDGEWILLMPCESMEQGHHLLSQLEMEVALTPYRLPEGITRDCELDGHFDILPVHKFDGYLHLWRSVKTRFIAQCAETKEIIQVVSH
ncbi:cache domain-containing protein [Vibrio sp. SCSIO 43132]|uniref:PDC sensor domain-containing protein n=1 Tax=Vibrio sp. SCSIO 43132 TaxID=2779363 RepID=UPI001CA9832E|nr:PDC sensor domain-containing protein [Vibrio sp. SCSIO 43132]UAB70107.1 cache domain-containing protein [Vibrio sp. SCSIO 43132]